MTTVTFYLQQNVSGTVQVLTGTWVRLTNNSTSATFISTAASDSNGLITVNTVPAGSYTVATGPTNVGAWTNTGDNNFTVEGTDSANLTTFPAAVTTTGEYTGADYKATGVVSLASPVNSRYIGSWSTTGSPTGLTGAVADWGIDGNQAIWICTVAGSPGTWITLPLGTLSGGYAQATVNQTLITAEVDATSLTTTVTTGAGRRIRITGFLPQIDSSVAGDFAILRIKEDGNQIQAAITELVVTTNEFPLSAVIVRQPAAGSHTYKLTIARSSGTGNIRIVAAATAPAFIHVEDVGV